MGIKRRILDYKLVESMSNRPHYIDILGNSSYKHKN